MAKARVYTKDLVQGFTTALDARISREMKSGSPGAADRCKVLFALKGVAENAPSTIRKAVEPHQKRAVKLERQANDLLTDAAFYAEISELVLGTFPAKEQPASSVDVDGDESDESDPAADAFGSAS